MVKKYANSKKCSFSVKSRKMVSWVCKPVIPEIFFEKKEKKSNK